MSPSASASRSDSVFSCERLTRTEQSTSSGESPKASRAERWRTFEFDEQADPLDT